MSVDEAKIKDLAERLNVEIEVARREGMSDIECGAAIGILLATVAPTKKDRDAIVVFAERHPRK